MQQSSLFENALNIPPLTLFAIILWEMVWKSIALWKSARNKHLYWFIAMIIFNTIGILPIVYIVFFSKKNK